MAKLRMHWELAKEPAAQGDKEAHFFLYREDEKVHCDHRRYSREELERRVGAILNTSGEVPVYYLHALEAFDDPRAPTAGDVPLDSTSSGRR